MGSNVKKVYLNDFDIFAKYFFYIYKVEHYINFKFLLYKLYLTILFLYFPRSRTVSTNSSFVKQFSCNYWRNTRCMCDRYNRSFVVFVFYTVCLLVKIFTYNIWDSKVWWGPKVKWSYQSPMVCAKPKWCSTPKSDEPRADVKIRLCETQNSDDSNFKPGLPKEKSGY